MPRYYFNVHDGSDFCDDVGTDLPSIAAAKDHAARYAGDLLRNAPQTFWSGEKWQLDVTDERGLHLFCLMFVAFDSPAGTWRPGSARD